MPVGVIGICPFGFVVVCAMVVEVSDDSEDLGTVMNFEPSLFVYFAVVWEVGDAGFEVGDWDLAVCWRWFAGIPTLC